ncbi:hypothetical protein [Cytobacillus gottheilii]|uniref:hypothetical protein n=1 Tax=Cytobacillus gottheilii TaxID=859144 RepID=UPI0009B9BE66|nr:hypothetical protein [Cytobacillus gottheilii]
MRQIVQLDGHIRQEVAEIECKWEKVAREFSAYYDQKFCMFNEELIIEVIRNQKGKLAAQTDIITPYYESYLEIGIESEDEYYPNAYIPIWKCKQETFQRVGYLTNRTITELGEILHEMIKEMLEDREGNGDYNE